MLRALIRSSLVLALLVPVTVACGGTKKDPNTVVDVQPGQMPEGGDWTGVYYSQLYGFLHVTENSGSVTGAWRTTAGDKWGELFGEVKGDLLKYTWKEHTIGAVGPNATTEGAGYFRYTIPKAEEAHEIKGEWGLGENNAGHTWAAIKQTNREPDPKSVRPSELENRVGAEGWDDSKGDMDVSSMETKEEKPKDDDKESEKSEKSGKSDKKSEE
jgi:hypothetical protein